jgi:hypothetical protein
LKAEQYDDCLAHYATVFEPALDWEQSSSTPTTGTSPLIPRSIVHGTGRLRIKRVADSVFR